LDVTQTKNVNKIYELEAIDHSFDSSNDFGNGGRISRVFVLHLTDYERRITTNQNILDLQSLMEFGEPFLRMRQGLLLNYLLFLLMKNFILSFLQDYR
jgi:hypothetical protein